MKKIKTYIQFIKESDEFEVKRDMVEINSIVDYTLLEESATEDDILELCRKANILGVKSVCVLPKMVKVAAEALKESKVLVCTVVSFPHGTDKVEQKMEEARRAILDGADEVDMVLNYKLFDKENFDDKLTIDVSSVVDVCHQYTNKEGKKVILKVIVESGLLTEEQTVLATKICLKSNADFIKTSTGKVPVGAELNKIKAMYNTIKSSGKTMFIKASGGVRDMSQINQFIPYVDRLGMGYASVDKLNGLESSINSNY